MIWEFSKTSGENKKAPSGHESSYEHRILERSLPTSCLCTASRSAANPRDPSVPDNYLLTFSFTVAFASFLPQDPFSTCISTIHLIWTSQTSVLVCDFPITGLLIFSRLITQVKGSQALQQHAIYIWKYAEKWTTSKYSFASLIYSHVKLHQC